MQDFIIIHVIIIHVAPCRLGQQAAYLHWPHCYGHREVAVIACHVIACHGLVDS